MYFLSYSVWREWIVEGDRFVGMLFEMGEKCTSGDRSVKVRVMAYLGIHTITRDKQRDVRNK